MWRPAGPAHGGPCQGFSLVGRAEVGAGRAGPARPVPIDMPSWAYGLGPMAWPPTVRPASIWVMYKYLGIISEYILGNLQHSEILNYQLRPTKTFSP